VLSEEQLCILEQVLNHRVAVITGGPGTGKTTLVRAVTTVLSGMGKKMLLAAPTGRAARRLSEVTHRPAETIHRLLRYNLSTGLFDKNQDDPLEADAVIIDEASMVDTLLMACLVSAVSMTSRLILVGDAFQLPSIGSGNVLADMIRSRMIPSFELTAIFRQARESPIVIAAHKVRNGEMPPLKPYAHFAGESDFFFIEEEDPKQAAAMVEQLCIRILPMALDLDPVSDIQVITPMHKGETGTLNLNYVLQKKMNPGQKSAVKAGRFKINDKVMHLKNNYQKEVFNGDIGMISEINLEKEELTVNYDGRMVLYQFDELDALTLAYAISVHKSQGSEYPAVIVLMMTGHFVLLQRNLLYTAITRGSRLVVIVGTRKALQIALNNNKPAERLSLLAHRLDSPAAI
jgi:exodeoxyribonuclease V alpha subunit